MGTVRHMTRFFLLVFCLASLSAFAQQVIEGRVVDKETGKPIPFASIGIVGTSKGTSTNLAGQFSLTVEERGAIKITCVGYESVQLTSLAFIEEIQLAPKATELQDVVVFSKGANAEKMVRKALVGISNNFPRQSFFQTYFYRHYCQDDGRYGRLIEAFVDVWRQNGYRDFRSSAGHREELRVTQLRRSLDRTAVSQSHEPLGIDNALLADIAAYQTTEESTRLDFYAGLNNLNKDIEQYDFTFGGLTSYDGEDVFEVKFTYPKKAPENAGRFPAGLSGALYVSADNYAIVRFEETRYKGNDTIRTSAFYQKHNEKYYPYHLVRDGGTYVAGKKVHWFHIEMMSAEINEDPRRHFEGKLPGKEELLAIAYDSTYWRKHSMLTTTPLEEEIIRDLGGGQSLEKQFGLYQQHDLNTRDGGINGESKLKWLIDFSKGRQPLIVCYWKGDYSKNAPELEEFKKINKKFRDQATFVMVSIDDDQQQWEEIVRNNNLALDGIVQYRISSINQAFERLPFYRISGHDGQLHDVLTSPGIALEDVIAEAVRTYPSK